MSLIDILAPVDSQEGTKMVLQSWVKEVGNSVVAYEPLIELETDKVTLEIEAPKDGVLVEVLVETGTEIEPGMVLGRLSTDAHVPDSSEEQLVSPQEVVTQTQKSTASVSQSNSALSPSVRRFVKANNIDTTQIIGTGRKGRITLEDAKKHLALSVSSGSDSVDPAIAKQPGVVSKSATGSTCIPHTRMRRAIAKHMHESVNTAPHVSSVFEVDFSAISAHRAAHKAEFSKQGVNLTYTAYLVVACVAAMKAVPHVNSQWHDDFIEVFSDINIGVGTALGDKGLIVPVIQKAQEMNLFGIAKALHGNTQRARDNKLTPEDVHGGTFTLSNHGVSGSLFATPVIINQPQSAILGVGKVEKRAVVRTVDGSDMIAIRPMAYVSLTIDHRVLDGQQTNAWLSTFVDALETWTI